MGPLGWQETVFIFVLALLFFGPKKLPELGKTIGKAITEFRRASNELKATFDREMRSMEQETQSLREITNSYHNELSNASSSYDSSYGYDSSGNYGYGDSNSESNGSSSSSSSTVSASAPEGAESTGTTATESGNGTATGVESTASGETTLAEAAEPGSEQRPASTAGGAASPESKAVTT